MNKDKKIKHEADDFELFAKLDPPLTTTQRRYLEMCLEECFVAGVASALETL